MKKKLQPDIVDYAERSLRDAVQYGGYRFQQLPPTDSALPLVSVITVTFNAQESLQRTLDSVRQQTYPNIEHIIVDGGSTDDTLALIKSQQESLALWCSGPDQGIYDAFNKGVALSRGEYVAILNADDYYEPTHIARAVATLQETKAPFVHGNMILHGWQGQDIFLGGDPHYVQKIRKGMPALFQVTVLCRREIFERYGLFPLQYRIAGDYEWFLRLAEHGCIGVYDDKLLAHMSAGGISTTRQRRSIWEVTLIMWRNGLPLTRVIRLATPRLLFPNGVPSFSVKRDFMGAAKGFLRKCWRWYRTRRSGRHSLPSSVEKQADLLEGFVNSRQICGTIEPLGFEWLHHVGKRIGTYLAESETREAQAVALMLHSVGAGRGSERNSAELLVCDSDSLDYDEVTTRAKHQTLIVVGECTWLPKECNVPFVVFGAVTAFGPYVDTAVSGGSRHEPSK